VCKGSEVEDSVGLRWELVKLVEGGVGGNISGSPISQHERELGRLSLVESSIIYYHSFRIDSYRNKPAYDP